MIIQINKYLPLFLSLLLFGAISGCQPKEQSEDDKLYREVMDRHDTIMEEMQTIYNLRKVIQDKYESLKSLGEVDEGVEKEIQLALSELDQANEGMMNWMRNFNTDYEETDGLTREQYLQSENEKIKGVGVKFNEAIRRAEDLLERL